MLINSYFPHFYKSYGFILKNYILKLLKIEKNWGKILRELYNLRK